jgi:hypothetical protein
MYIHDLRDACCLACGSRHAVNTRCKLQVLSHNVMEIDELIVGQEPATACLLTMMFVDKSLSEFVSWCSSILARAGWSRRKQAALMYLLTSHAA